jgi:rRNA maturation endonuclease Nob1
VLQLRGVLAGKMATKAVTVETKLHCITCGKSSKSSEKFCGQCGTALQII